MKTKTIFNLLAFAMLMPAMLLTTACSSSEDLADNKPETTEPTEPTEPVAKKGYKLPVTINVTRQGDDATRASYTDNGDGTGSLSFSTGDQLFVKGEDTSENGAGKFAGTIEWQSGGKFSGTITTENSYTGTAEELLSSATNAKALLLPDGYTTYNYIILHPENGYDAYFGHNSNNVFAATKAEAVEQFSDERADSYSNGFALAPQNAILNFTINGLTKNTTVAIKFTGTNVGTINKTVTVDNDGKATFAIGVENNTNLNQYALTVDGYVIILGSHALVAGKIYNITRDANTISGKFSVSATKQVYFSRSNLQAMTSDDGYTWTWHFADKQNARVGNGANIYINGDGSVISGGNGKNIDLFGWSTASTYLGINNSTKNIDYQYNNKTDGSDFVDWGSHADVIAGIGTGWRTLTSDEWMYLMVTRSGNRYALASIGSRGGIILLPDDWDTSYYSLSSINNDNVAFTVNDITDADWTSKLEAHGAVFLPVAGRRRGTTVNDANDQLHYWSSTGGVNNQGIPNANHLRFMPPGNTSAGLAPDYGAERCYGFSVRLVRDVE